MKSDSKEKESSEKTGKRPRIPKTEPKYVNRQREDPKGDEAIEEFVGSDPQRREKKSPEK